MFFLSFSLQISEKNCFIFHFMYFLKILFKKIIKRTIILTLFYIKVTSVVAFFN